MFCLTGFSKNNNSYQSYVRFLSNAEPKRAISVAFLMKNN